MYNIIISEKVHNLINDFIIWYRKTFLNLFDDTWIEDELLIREIYIKSSKEFKNKIYKNIENYLITNKILWNQIIKNNFYLVTIPVNNFRLFITYKENTINKERYIENIEFYKK